MSKRPRQVTLQEASAARDCYHIPTCQQQPGRHLGFGHHLSSHCPLACPPKPLGSQQAVAEPPKLGWLEKS